ncbi:MAG: tRNA (adenosine(37)-N6)-threonylcarbamoyltransferase complex ATPase subunit type 1 TsaE [Clostridiales bacterium]|nr:tRNA (adenosine(37)-N6)-threonylcarbamoyltransferase complex ATPase subunit type 1 TsaE [Clostridiales bacterium]
MDEINRFKLKNEKETEEFGRMLAAELEAGDVIALTGDLGAGKTTLAKAIAKGLGVEETLTSPTFTILQEYESGRLPLYHFDVYRVHSEEELFEIGMEDYFYRSGVCLIEWADLIEDLLPENRRTIKISRGENESERICEIS